MKKLLLLILLCPVSFCFAQQNEVNLADVPREVLKSFITIAPEHDDSKWSKNIKQHFVVHTIINNHKAMFVFREDGSLVLSAEKIAFDEVSDSAKVFFKTHHADEKITYCNRLKFSKDQGVELIGGYLSPDPHKESWQPFPNYVPPIFSEEGEFLK